MALDLTHAPPPEAGVRRAFADLLCLPGEELAGRKDLFPEGLYDQDLQQIDLRSRNSWRLLMAEVSPVELLEVHLINAIAPFIINARLKPLMMRTPERDKHIVNVSAVEGQFYRNWKTTRHPHTNMAKAALNMMTRTAATDYYGDGIHMNSVDTGWVTDEDPEEIAARRRPNRAPIRRSILSTARRASSIRLSAAVNTGTACPGAIPERLPAGRLVGPSDPPPPGGRPRNIYFCRPHAPLPPPELLSCYNVCFARIPDDAQQYAARAGRSLAQYQGGRHHRLPAGLDKIDPSAVRQGQTINDAKFGRGTGSLFRSPPVPR